MPGRGCVVCWLSCGDVGGGRARGVWCGWVVALGCAARGVFGVRCLCQCRKWCANPLHIRLVESSGV